MRGAHVLSSGQFGLDTLGRIYEVADMLEPVARGRRHTRILDGAVLGSLFFEASTRTRLSFDAAFQRLGGAVSHTTGVTFSSISKGESLEDTARTIAGYVDVFAIRHPEEGAVRRFASATLVPVINAGDGSAEHPTQALLDLYTVRRELGRLGKPVEEARIALVGDLRHGRTVHSLIRLLSLFPSVRFSLVAPAGLEMPREMVAEAGRRVAEVREHESLREGLAGCDVVYATRVQHERIPAESGAGGYGIEFMVGRRLVDEVCPRDVVILHPMPRDSRPGANDLSTDLDGDPRLAIFRQSDAGVQVRMALFALVLGVDDRIGGSLLPVSWSRPARSGPNDAGLGGGRPPV